MFPAYLGAVNTAYNRGCGPCFLVSAVSRILWVDAKRPAQASKVDFMVVMESEQGDGKTTAVGELFDPNWYAEATESPTHKDFFQTLRGRWGVEIGEMESFSKAEVGKIKQVITIRSDVYRASYARTPRAYRRECVFVGTTNKDDWLRDETGGRRFLPVKVGAVDIPRIVADRDQLWAEAVQLYRDGFKWWALPEDAKREQDKRYSEDVWTSRVVRWLDGDTKANLYEQLPTDRVESSQRTVGDKWVSVERVRECSIAEILSFAIGIEAGRQGRPEATRVGAIMTRLRWGHYRPTHAGERVRFYVRPVPT
jgi:predicted P-loop ATPase